MSHSKSYKGTDSHVQQDPLTPSTRPPDATHYIAGHATDQEATMNDNPFQAPRVAFGLAAMAMSTLAFGVMVVLPARIESEGRVNAILAAAPPAVGPCVRALPEAQPRQSN